MIGYTISLIRHVMRPGSGRDPPWGCHERFSRMLVIAEIAHWVVTLIALVSFLIACWSFVFFFLSYKTRFLPPILLLGPIAMLINPFWEERGFAHRRRFLIALPVALLTIWAITHYNL